jgi:hypothetical protein
MRAARRLAAFALVLAVCFASAYAVGAAVDPVDPDPIDRVPAGTSPHGGGHGG